MPSVAKAKFCRDAYLKNDTSPETLEKIKSLMNDTEVMPWLRIPVADWEKGELILLGEMECEEGELSYPLNYVIELYEAYMEEYKKKTLCLFIRTYFLFPTVEYDHLMILFHHN